MDVEGGTFVAAVRSVDAPDRVTVYGWKVLAGSVIGYSMGGFDLMIVSFVLAAISADLGLASAQAGSLVTWTLMGAVGGGLIFGTLSDHSRTNRRIHKSNIPLLFLLHRLATLQIT